MPCVQRELHDVQYAPIAQREKYDALWHYEQHDFYGLCCVLYCVYERLYCYAFCSNGEPVRQNVYGAFVLYEPALLQPVEW
jgi:hypothetical protein